MRKALGIARGLGRPGALAAALVAGAAIAVAGCGSGATSAGSSAGAVAGFVPAGSPLYLEASTDTNSAQWRQVVALGKKFPGWRELTTSVNKSLKDEGVDYDTDIKPYVGERAAVAVTRAPRLSASAGTNGSARAAAEATGVLAVAELAPGKDAAVGDELAKAAKGAPGDHAGVKVYTLDDDKVAAVDDGAALLASTREDLFAAIDAHAAGGDKTLAGTARFTDALKQLPADVFAQGYIDVGAITSSAAGAGSALNLPTGVAPLKDAAVAVSLTAEARGVRLKGVVTGAGDAASDAQEFTPTLTNQVPGDAVAYLGFNDLASLVGNAVDQVGQASPEIKKQIVALTGQIEPMLGVSLDDLSALTSLEGAVAVTKGAPVPTVALLLQQADGARAQKTLDTLRSKVPSVVKSLSPNTKLPDWSPVPLANGVSGWQLPLSPQAGVVYGVDGNLAIIGTLPDGVRQIQQPLSPLSKNQEFVAATSGMPDKVTGLAWVNVEEAVNLLDANGAFKRNQKLLDNLRPLKSVVAWGTGGGTPTFEAFATIE
jgi:Protein of unknown function (DUF3352)